MSTDSEHRQPSFRFRDRLSRLKDRVKDKVKDKAIKHNITLFVHQNFTSNNTHEDYSHTTRYGFRQHMHHYKDVLKNKTHYESIKDKIKDKIDDKFDLHHNKTYPKGFYDSLFSPESENDVYLQTALICLWVIAVLCIIPTIIIIFLPARKKNGKTTSTNMIFFHVFFCELCYLSYVLLAMINVAKDFRLGSTLCDFANYGMYVTIPIMQFALLFLSLERLSKHITMTWVKIFTKPYLIQVILCAIWIFLIALLTTFMFIKKQFNFSFVKEQIINIAPPILGDVVSTLASRRHHCSIDGRLSSVFKTVIIILFIILIVKPIALSLGFNFLTPFCCKGRQKRPGKDDDGRTGRLVTIFLLLNFFCSFPFYFASMFKSIFTNIDSTKDTFSIVLKICFILRITNIIFECLAFYIFERNSWNLLSKIFYYGTCKKFPIFKSTKDPKVLKVIKRVREDSNDDDEEARIKSNNKKKLDEDEDEDEDDDGALVNKSKKQSKITRDKTPVESEDEKLIKPTKNRSSKQTVDTDEDKTEKKIKKKSKSPKKKAEKDKDESEGSVTSKEKSKIKQAESDDEIEEEEETKEVTTTKKRRSRTKEPENDEEETEKVTTTTKRKSRTKEPESDEEETEKVTTTTKRKSRTKEPESDEEEQEIIRTIQRKPRSKTGEEEPKSKSRRNGAEARIPNGTSATTTSKTTHKHSNSTSQKPIRHQTPSPHESDADASQTPKPVRKPSTEARTRHISPVDQHSRHRTKSPSSSSHPRNKAKKKSRQGRKKPKKDRQTRILEMSDDV